MFPKMSSESGHGDSSTCFKADLLQYIQAYGATKLAAWETHIRNHDMSSAKLVFCYLFLNS